jgi:hypothetical protein
MASRPPGRRTAAAFVAPAFRSIQCQAVPTGVPILTEAGRVVQDYLTAERELGRIPVDTDIDTLGLTLIGSTHMMFADRTGPRPSREDVSRFVGSVVPG